MVIVGALCTLQMLETQVDKVLVSQLGEQLADWVPRLSADVPHELTLTLVVKIRPDSRIQKRRRESSHGCLYYLVRSSSEHDRLRRIHRACRSDHIRELNGPLVDFLAAALALERVSVLKQFVVARSFRIE